MTSDPASAERPTTSSGNLVLETPNPKDLSLDDLTGLATRLRDALAASGLRDLQVLVKGEEPRGAGNQFVDYLYMILPHAEFMKDTLFATVVAQGTALMRERFKRKHESKRPRQIKFFDPEGQLLGTLQIESQDAETEWLEPTKE